MNPVDASPAAASLPPAAPGSLVPLVTAALADATAAAPAAPDSSAPRAPPPSLAAVLALADVESLETALQAARAKQGADRALPPFLQAEAADASPNHFEGPEKNLEMEFLAGPNSPPNGLRAMQRAQLDAICEAAKCLILSAVCNEHIDAYVLSESSLFVLQNKLVLKTCGTTTLLRCLPLIIQYAAALDMAVDWLAYSRKDFTRPSEQLYPHSSFPDEIGFLHSTLSGGEGYVLGPVTKDHWHVFVHDVSESLSAEMTVNIMMFDMDADVLEQFHKTPERTAAGVTTSSGIADLIPGATCDAVLFEPCGYSMNAILYDTYSTVHVTPEPEFSYASFETSQSMASYDSLINNVLSVFRPRRFIVTLFADCPALQRMITLPFARNVISVPGLDDFQLRTSCTSRFEGDYECVMGVWSAEGSPKREKEVDEGRERRRRGMSVS